MRCVARDLFKDSKTKEKDGGNLYLLPSAVYVTLKLFIVNHSRWSCEKKKMVRLIPTRSSQKHKIDILPTKISKNIRLAINPSDWLHVVVDSLHLLSG